MIALHDRTITHLAKRSAHTPSHTPGTEPRMENAEAIAPRPGHAQAGEMAGTTEDGDAPRDSDGVMVVSAHARCPTTQRVGRVRPDDSLAGSASPQPAVATARGQSIMTQSLSAAAVKALHS